jgi:hypothetical protein
MTYLLPVSDQRGLAGKHGLFINKTKFVKKANQVHVFELTHEFSFKPVDGTMHIIQFVE